MAQQQFNPTPDLTTHSEARALFNANFQDAEDRLNALETSIDLKSKQTSAASSGGLLSIDASEAYVHAVTLTEDVVDFSITNFVTGDGGSLVIRQDDAGGWGIDFGDYKIVGGYADIITGITPSGVGGCYVNWYNDGIDLTISVNTPF